MVPKNQTKSAEICGKSAGNLDGIWIGIWIGLCRALLQLKNTEVQSRNGSAMANKFSLTATAEPSRGTASIDKAQAHRKATAIVVEEGPSRLRFEDANQRPNALSQSTHAVVMLQPSGRVAQIQGRNCDRCSWHHRPVLKAGRSSGRGGAHAGQQPSAQ